MQAGGLPPQAGALHYRQPEHSCLCFPHSFHIISADAEGGLAAAAPLAISCWRGRGSLNVLVSKQEAAQLADRILEARAKKAAAATAAAEQQQQGQQEEASEPMAA
jgi:hypothetical protein